MAFPTFFSDKRPLSPKEIPPSLSFPFFLGRGKIGGSLSFFFYHLVARGFFFFPCLAAVLGLDRPWLISFFLSFREQSNSDFFCFAIALGERRVVSFPPKVELFPLFLLADNDQRRPPFLFFLIPGVLDCHFFSLARHAGCAFSFSSRRDRLTFFFCPFSSRRR